MIEYWAATSIKRDDAQGVLADLATDGSDLRNRLEESQQSAREALDERGILVAIDQIPEKIKLPPAEDVQRLRDRVEQMVPQDRGPFAWFILAIVFAAMPVVARSPEGDGTG